MPNDQVAWFVTERSEALAGWLLTARKDVKVRSERKTDGGVDFLLEVSQDDKPSMRLFVVQVRGTTSSERAEWMASVNHLFQSSHGPFYTPACVLVVNVRDNKAFYAWAAEPRVRDGEVELHFDTSPQFRDLTPASVDEIVGCVNAWYDALPAVFMEKRA